MRLLNEDTAVDIVIFMVDAADNASGKTGLTLTITASKNGGAFAGISPNVTDLGNGFYKLELTTTHTNTQGDLWLYITGTGAIPLPEYSQVLAYQPGINDDDILSAVNTINSATGNLPSDPADASVIAARFDTLDTNIAAINSKTTNLPSDPADASDVAAAVLAAKSIAKNVAFTNFKFAMYDEDGEPATSLTVTAEISKDGGAFAATADAVEEISNGFYKVDLSQTEMNAKVIALRATATGAKETQLSIITEG